MHFVRFVPMFILLLAFAPGAGEANSARQCAAISAALVNAVDAGPARAACKGSWRAMASRKGPPFDGGLAKGAFLVASETLSDPNFSQTVVLLLEYDYTGAVGLVINRPTEVPLASLLPAEDDLKSREDLVFVGGPVGTTRLFLLVRSTQRPRQSERVVEGVYASTSLETLREIVAEDSAVSAFKAYAGYAGWGPGQLDAEFTRGDWLVTPADAESVFDKATHTIWQELIQKNKGLWVHQPPADKTPFTIASWLKIPAVDR